MAVLLAKDPFESRHQWGDASYEQGISEVVNDTFRPLQNFWDVLQCETTFAEFCHMVEATPFRKSSSNVPNNVTIQINYMMWQRRLPSLPAAVRAALVDFVTLPR